MGKIITAIAPGVGAADPKHPDHARWVKERTLRMEAEHARATGATFRSAEVANTRQLERLAARQRERLIIVPPHPPKPAPTRAEIATAGVTRRPAKAKRLAVSPCRNCGACRRCRREARVRLIMSKARQQDIVAHVLAMEVVALNLAEMKRSDYRDSLGREIAFSRMLTQTDRNRGVTAGIEWVCDRSVPLLGEWR